MKVVKEMEDKIINVPTGLIIKEEDDLMNKLREGMEDIEEGNVCTIEEAYKER